jgi:hypothetical protein
LARLPGKMLRSQALLEDELMSHKMAESLLKNLLDALGGQSWALIMTEKRQ